MHRQQASRRMAGRIFLRWLAHPLHSYFYIYRCDHSNHHVGDCLISSGDDGVVRFWKKALSGEWLEYAETEMADQENK